MHVGWDWASRNHDVTVIDDAGVIQARFAIGHDEASLEGVLGELASLADPADLPVAIERPDGIIVERLVVAGHPVVPVHPNAFHAARSRWGAGRAKSDPADSYMLADYLRTDGHRLRRLRPLDPITRELQALVRMRGDHVAARTAATNQLHALLEAHWPGANAIFSRLGSTIALAFLGDYPTPESAVRLGEARLAMFCRRHSYRGGRTPTELLQRLRTAAIAPVGLDPIVLTELVQAQTTLIESALRFHRRTRRRNRRVAAGAPQSRAPATTPTHRRDQPGSDHRRNRTTPRSLRQRRPSSRSLRRRPDHPPVRQDPQRPVPVLQQRRARVALTCFADNSRHSSAWAQHLYTSRPPPRHPPPPRRPDRRTGMAPSHLGMLAQPHRLQPHTPRQRSPPRRLT